MNRSKSIHRWRVLAILIVVSSLLIRPSGVSARQEPLVAPQQVVPNAPINDFPHCTDWSYAKGGHDDQITNFTAEFSIPVKQDLQWIDPFVPFGVMTTPT